MCCRPELANVSRGATRGNQGAKGTLGENDDRARYASAAGPAKRLGRNPQHGLNPGVQASGLGGPARSQADQNLLAQGEEKTGLRPQSGSGAHGAPW